MSDLYGALGVGKDANPEDIRKAYRKASKKAHPDAGGSGEKFALIKLAADVLGDPERRAAYDQTGNVDEKAQDKSMSVVMMALDSVLNECERRGIGPETVDVIADAKKTLKIKLEQMDEANRAAKKNIEKAKRLIKRFKAKSGKQNRIGPLIEGRIRQAEFDANNAMKDRPSIVTAMEILSDHAFDWTDDSAGNHYSTMNLPGFVRMMGGGPTF